MNHAERLLARLDARLDGTADLTLYGRAALHLGYSRPKPEYALSLDVDVVLWMGQADELERSGNFWVALEQVNREFEADGLSMSHLFDEDQVVLSADWRSQRVRLPGGAYRRLVLHRLSDADMLLSKLMRFDPTDLEDLAFVVARSGLRPAAVADAIRQARIPDSAEVREQVALCHDWLVAQGLCAH
jgi:hypothetical protein